VIIKKSPEEIEKMARAGAILVATLDLIEGKIRPGVSTGSSTRPPSASSARGRGADVQGLPRLSRLDLRLAERDDRARDPRALPLKAGDIISIDVGVTLDGWVADAARTFPWSRSAEQAQNLLRRPRSRCTPASPVPRGQPHGRRLQRDPAVAEGAGLSVVRSLVGHGVGRSMHEDPQVPNYGKPGKGPLLEEGMVLAIEPMTTAGRPAVRVGGDGWAIFSQDGSPAAHFEFTVAITAAGRGSSRPGTPPRTRPSAVAEGVAAPSWGPRARPRAPARALRRGVATIRSPARTRGVCAREGISTTR
jgi:methionyl aminopeptidase